MGQKATNIPNCMYSILFEGNALCEHDGCDDGGVQHVSTIPEGENEAKKQNTQKGKI